MDNKTNLIPLLDYIDPGSLSYLEWTQVGMALKHEGYLYSDWEAWSARDVGRYHPGECQRKWSTFQEGTSEIVTGGTIYQMAVEGGYVPPSDRELDWDDIYLDGKIIDPAWVEASPIMEPVTWHPGKEVSRYIETLFEPTETIGYVMQSRYDEERDKYIPSGKGTYSLTAGEILEKISKHGDDLGASLGDYNRKAGAWIRFNPLDGQGVSNKNVSELRYALVESDSLDVEKQAQIIRDLELPVAVLMYSGKKSVHAIVRIDAADYKEYQARVDKLYSICAKNGLQVDTQNKNPSRLSRLPGCERGDKKQFIIDTNIGKKNYAEWLEYIEAATDDLPDLEGLSDVWDNLPELSAPLIDGILRKGHKMLIAGPSKAGKSFLLIELAIAIAEGRKWLGYQCSKGRVMYVNLELDRASCLHRFKDMYAAMGASKPKSIENIDIWNLRGKAVPMDRLAPMLIRRAKKKNYAAIIVDPIYKIITGDENSAEQMAKFCNQFDKICTELGCATIYCHHHSKGAQGGKKSMDRASGSGVFARDPDAQLDMIELEMSKALREQEENKAVCAAVKCYLESTAGSTGIYWTDIPEDSQVMQQQCVAFCENMFTGEKAWRMNTLRKQIEEARMQAANLTAWRLEATLREFAPIPPINIYFSYPVHLMDDTGALSDIEPEAEKTPWEKGKEQRKKQAEKQKKDRIDAFEMTFATLNADGEEVSAQDMADAMGVTSKTLLAWIGDTKRRNKVLAERFEKYGNESGGKMFIRKIEWDAQGAHD